MAIFTQKNDTQTSEFYIKNSLQNGDFYDFCRLALKSSRFMVRSNCLDYCTCALRRV